MIIGLHGCSCHPFKDWKECDRMHKQKFKVGDRVITRHSGKVGVIHKVEERYYYIVKFGNYRNTEVLYHSAELNIYKNLSLTEVIILVNG
jgi:preprotein translocase subunit YajC